MTAYKSREDTIDFFLEIIKKISTVSLEDIRFLNRGI